MDKHCYAGHSLIISFSSFHLPHLLPTVLGITAIIVFPWVMELSSFVVNFMCVCAVVYREPGKSARKKYGLIPPK